jgi:hypothetical protein
MPLINAVTFLVMLRKFIFIRVATSQSQTTQTHTKINFCLLQPLHSVVLKLKCSEFCLINFAYFIFMARSCLSCHFYDIRHCMKYELSKKYPVAKVEMSSLSFRSYTDPFYYILRSTEKVSVAMTLSLLFGGVHSQPDTRCPEWTLLVQSRSLTSKMLGKVFNKTTVAFLKSLSIIFHRRSSYHSTPYMLALPFNAI